MLLPWCIKPPKIVLDLVHLKKGRTDASVYKQLFMEIRDWYLDHIPVYTDGSWDGNSVVCATVFPSNTVISMRLPDSAFIFTAEIWTIIKALKEVTNSVSFKYIVFTLTFVSPSFTIYEAGTYLDWDGDMKVILLNFCQKQHYFLLRTQPYWH